MVQVGRDGTAGKGMAQVGKDGRVEREWHSWKGAGTSEKGNGTAGKGWHRWKGNGTGRKGMAQVGRGGIAGNGMAQLR